ncbi:MAG: transposase [Campylobacterales bacterium]|nr:transposase [Campylobacterales bacterium]
MELQLRIIEIILQSIKYRNKELLLNLIKAELISSSGYLTELAMMVNPKKYHSIHKLFSRVRFDYVAIQIEIIVLILLFFQIMNISVSIDDSIVYRSRKKKVPHGHKQYDHANKANRSSYVYGQRWLALGLIIKIGGKSITLPLYIHLVKPKKNLITTTIFIVGKMKRIMDKRGLTIKVEMITDSWFAKKRLILWAVNRCNFSVITMARKDLVIYKLPPVRRKGTKGATRKKGKRIKPELEDLKKERTLYIYGKDQKVQYKEAIVKTRFLSNDITVKAVWVKFEDSQSINLLISTDTTLKGEEIIKRYAKRWDIEPMFNELKNRFRFKDIMMHTSRTYYQFLYFKIWCFILLKLSSVQLKQTVIDYIKDFLPWRVHHKKGITVTAGNTQLALRNIFVTLRISMFFPNVDKKIEGDYANNAFLGLGLDMGCEKTG